MAPKGVPAPVVDRLRAALGTALQHPSVREAFTSNGAVATTSTPQEYRAYLAADIQRTREAIRVANVQPQ
jgi:tripartite-type tricarboxylate transporter receptor subunit TctC